MTQASAAEEACAYRLLIKHGRKNALRELVRQREVTDAWPDEALLSIVNILVSKGAELVEDAQDPDFTVGYARHRFAETTNAGRDIGPCARLLALLMSAAMLAESGHLQQSATGLCSGGSGGTGAGAGSAADGRVEQPWGAHPVTDVRCVMRHVLHHYSREQQRAIAATHPDCATALLAAACGAGPSMRDVVHWALAQGADVNGLLLPRRRVRRAIKAVAQCDAVTEPVAAVGSAGQQQQQRQEATSATDVTAANGHVHSDAVVHVGGRGPVMGIDPVVHTEVGVAADGGACTCSPGTPCHVQGLVCGAGDGAAYLACTSPHGAAGDKGAMGKGADIGGLGCSNHDGHKQVWGEQQSPDSCGGEDEEGEGEGEDVGCRALSPLVEAAAAGDRYLVELLIEVHGADPTAHGGLAEAVARGAGHHQVANIIFERGVARRAARASAATPGSAPDGSEGHGRSGRGGLYVGKGRVAGARQSGAANGHHLLPTGNTYQYVTLSDWLMSVMPRWRMPSLWPFTSPASPPGNGKSRRRSSSSSSSGRTHDATASAPVHYSSTAGASTVTCIAAAGVLVGGAALAAMYMSRRGSSCGGSSQPKAV